MNYPTQGVFEERREQQAQEFKRCMGMFVVEQERELIQQRKKLYEELKARNEKGQVPSTVMIEFEYWKY